MRFGTIIADPPWSYYSTNKRRHAKLSGYADSKYGTISIDDLRGMDVQSVCDDRCVLLLWACNPLVPVALSLVSSWGFRFKTMGSWNKLTKKGRSSYGPGYWLRSSNEPWIIAVRGKGRTVRTNERSCFSERSLGHSVKPDNLHMIAEKHLTGPYLELFGRRNRPGWTVVGNEAPDTMGEDIRDSLRRLASEDTEINSA